MTATPRDPAQAAVAGAAALAGGEADRAKQKISLEAQVAEIERELRARAHVYPRLVENGRLKKETAARHVAHLEAALATLNWIGGLRDQLYDLKRKSAASAVVGNAALSDAELLTHPAVVAVLAAFPEATVTNPFHTPDLFHQEDA